MRADKDQELASLLPSLADTDPKRLSKHVVMDESISRLRQQKTRLEAATNQIRALEHERDYLISELNRLCLGLEPDSLGREPYSPRPLLDQTIESGLLHTEVYNHFEAMPGEGYDESEDGPEADLHGHLISQSGVLLDGYPSTDSSGPQLEDSTRLLDPAAVPHLPSVAPQGFQDVLERWTAAPLPDIAQTGAIALQREDTNMIIPDMDSQDLLRPSGANGSVACGKEIPFTGNLDDPRPLAPPGVLGMCGVPGSVSDAAFGILSPSLSVLGGVFSWEGVHIPQEPALHASRRNLASGSYPNHIPPISLNTSNAWAP